MASVTAIKKLSLKQRAELLNVLQTRFEKNMNRHEGLEWAKIRARLEADEETLWSLNEMERTGGEPDVVGQDKTTGKYIFFDCSTESPKFRRSLCYDRQALDSRKENKPKDNALGMAQAMGIELLTEEQYGELQELGALTRRLRVGSVRLPIYENSAARFSGIAALAEFLSIITVPSRTMPPGGFAVRSGYKLQF